MTAEQKWIIVGTAGHIDHGKTALTKSLTGCDTDRLPEEKTRGISIGLGFAPLPLSPDLHLAFVDVPGHERFVKTMLLGASSVDLALLVVAADSGIMPQTREHLAILNLLGVSCGLVAITKIDLVPQEKLDVLKEEVQALLAPTTLKDSPLVFVSCKTGQGLAQCRESLHRLAVGVAPKPANGAARLPIDRVFTVKGFGTVVTGSLWSGSLHIGDTLTLWPGDIEVKIRQLEVHGQKVPTALAGQRVACNLAAIGKEEIPKHAWLAEKGLLSASLCMDVQFSLLKAAKALKHRQRIFIHHGSSMVLGRVHLPDSDQLLPGNSAFGQLLLEEPLFPLAKDTLILRSYSPNETIGKAIVLQTAARRRKRGSKGPFNDMEKNTAGGAAAQMTALIVQKPGFFTAADLAKESGLATEEVECLLSDLPVLFFAAGGQYFGRENFARLGEQISRVISSYEQRYPMRPGLPQAQAQSSLPLALSRPQKTALLARLAEAGFFQLAGAFWHSPKFTPHIPAGLQEGAQAVYQTIVAADLMPEDFDRLGETFPGSKEELHDVLLYFAAQGRLIKVEEKQYYAPQALQKAIDRLRQAFGRRQFGLGEARDALGVTRKYALLLLAYLERSKTLGRREDLRFFY